MGDKFYNELLSLKVYEIMSMVQDNFLLLKELDLYDNSAILQ